MFPLHFQVGSIPLSHRPQQAGAGPGQCFLAGRILRGVALLGALALGLPRTASAQSLGTMQVTARVVPASVAWTGVAEAGEAARTAARERYGRPLVRRRGLVHAWAEIHPSEGRLLIVTIQHPHN
jgi:hypothetical protein